MKSAMYRPEGGSRRWHSLGPRQWLLGAALILQIGLCPPVRGQQSDLREFFPQLTGSDWDEMAATLNLGQAAEPNLQQVLYQLSNIPEAIWKSAATENTTSLQQAARQPAKFGGSVFAFSGNLRRYEKPWDLEIDPATGVLSTTGQRILIADDGGGDIWVLAGALPRALQGSSEVTATRWIGQHFAGFGVFVGCDHGAPVLAAPTAAWLPDHPDANLNIGYGQVALAGAGLDLGLFDSVHNRSDMAIGPSESELFRRSLEACGRLGPQYTAESLQTNAAIFDLVELVRNPSVNTGQLIWVSGELRRITPVQVNEPEMRVAIAGDEYYELDVFVSLGNKRITLGNDPSGKPLEIRGSYGITVITSRLPSGLDTARLPVEIEVPAFMLKIWEHKSMATAQVSETLRRPNPVLLAIPGQLKVVTRGNPGFLLAWMIPALALGLAILLAGLFFVSRDRRLSRAEQKRSPRTPDFSGISRNERNET
jgi:hypothetical protein